MPLAQEAPRQDASVLAPWKIAAAVLIGLLLMPVAASGDEAPRYAARVVNPKFVHGTFEPVFRTFLVCGTDGAIVRSTDGRTWLPAETPTAIDLARIASDGAGRVVIAVGANGTIIRSDDKGKTWKQSTTPRPDSDLRAVVHHAA